MSSVEVGVDHQTLSGYLAGVERAVKQALPEPAWLVAELSSFTVTGKGSVFLDLLESADGREVAKAKGVMFANVARRVLEQWRASTGGIPEAGMRVLVKVRADFSVQYGFQLQVSQIDPSYTLGEMQAKLQQIISTLTAKGWYDMQRSLASPSGFWRVAVVSPHEAAGLADFKRDADMMADAGVCQFEYFSATFQGAGCSESIRGALLQVHERNQEERFDLVCVIRGGGAKADLAWLNDMQLAAWVCRFPVPVFTGIGHQVDECVLDLVAHRKFDTPSKVIGYLKSSLQAEAAGLRARMEQVASRISRLAADQLPLLERQVSRFGGLSQRFVHGQKAAQERAWSDFARLATMRTSEDTKTLLRAPEAFSRLSGSLCAAQRAKIALASSQVASRAYLVLERGRGQLEMACQLYDKTNPLTLLARGFALVRGPDGAIISSAESARAAGTLQLAFADGQLTVVPK
jgi:exodeoxyribonuclease VII large subunit